MGADEFNDLVKKLKAIALTVQSVNDLKNEEEDLAFIQAFRKLIRVNNILVTFIDFNMSKTYLSEQRFADYKSKYLDLHNKYKGATSTKDSIIDDVDFEIELIHRDDINVTYILNLLKALKSDLTIDGQMEKRKQIVYILSGNKDLRSKRELIEQFIDENLIHINDSDDVEDSFDEFWNTEKEKSLMALCKEEKINPEIMNQIASNYIYSNQNILTDDIIDSLDEKPKLLERKPIAKRVIEKIYDFLETFVYGIRA